MQFEKKHTLVSFSKRLQIAVILRTCGILMVFEKLTRACFLQIPLGTILLPIQIKHVG